MSTKDKSLKVAILYAYRNEDFFTQLKGALNRPRLIEKDGYHFELFHVCGNFMTKGELKIRDFLDDLRYSRVWPLQYLIDNLVFHAKLRFVGLPSAMVNEDKIVVKIEDDLRHLSLKMLAALSYIRELEYDYIIRTTMSSLINLNYLTKFLQRNSSGKPLYAGRSLELPNRNPIASGAFTLLSKNTVDELMNYLRKMNFGILDDVSIGRVLTPLIDFVSLPSYDVRNFKSLEDLKRLGLENFAHFRCKSDSLPRQDLYLIQCMAKQFGSSQDLV